MNKMKREILLFKFLMVLIIVLNYSCINQRKTLKKPLKEQGADYLFEQLKKNELKYNLFSAKLSVTVNENKNSNTFYGNIRLKRDTVIWLSVTPAVGIEMLRVLITPDSLKIINRLKQTYLAEKFDYINSVFDTDLDFDVFQAFIIGNDLSYYENNKFKASIDNKKYLLSTVGRRKIKKFVKQNENLKVMLQKIWINPESFKIEKISINEINENRKIEAKYSLFNQLNDQKFAHHVEYEMVADKKMYIMIDYSKVLIDNPFEIPFNIPDKYEKMEK
jgi:hypothetical protein